MSRAVFLDTWVSLDVRHPGGYQIHTESESGSSLSVFHLVDQEFPAFLHVERAAGADVGHISITLLVQPECWALH